MSYAISDCLTYCKIKFSSAKRKLGTMKNGITRLDGLKVIHSAMFFMRQVRRRLHLAMGLGTAGGFLGSSQVSFVKKITEYQPFDNGFVETMECKGVYRQIGDS
jgi:hypothetical protein